MTTLRATPGAWIVVTIPTGTITATMTIGDSPPQPAFIENIRSRRGVETHAKRRCPDLRPGRYAVRAVTADGVTEAQLTVT